MRRRHFTALIAGSPALLAQQPAAPAAPQGRGRPPEVAPFQAPLEFKRQDVAPKAEPFPMTQVRLLPGAFHDAQEWNRGFLSRLAVDRLVYNFRANAALPGAPEKPFGGWEQPNNGERASELRGHFTGHFLSASAQLYASTGDKDAKAKADEMVGELAKCQQSLGGKYLSAFPTEFWDRLDARKNVWAPFYTIHKIMAGMFDMYRLAGNQQALTVLEGMAAWADEWTAPKSEEHMQEILNTEYGGMNEVLYNLAAATNNDHWATVGDRFTKKIFFNPLASRRDELRGLHVNTHIPQVIGAARRFEISGDTRFHDVADYFFYEVSTARSYVTNGTSNGEGWQAPPRRLAAELKLSTNTAECCCAYNMLKLARHMYEWNPSPTYFDYYERTLLNHRLGTIQPQTGHTQYYLSHTPGAWRTYCDDDQCFWCCTGSGVEEYSKLNDSIYWRDPAGVFVNLFIPSELNWSERGFRLRQETRFPEEQDTRFTVNVDKPLELTVRLRVPSWMAAGPTVKVNGKALDATATPGSYLSLTRMWKSGDKIEMELPMHLQAEAMPDDPQMQAFLYGPLVLAGDLGTAGVTEANSIRALGPALRQAPAVEIPAFRAAGELSTWIKPDGKAPLTFRTAGQTRDVTLTPFNRLIGKRYSMYWQVS
jgi:uncharacterized protein